MIIADASTLTDLVLGRGRAVAAVQEALGDDRLQPLHAPDLVWPEALSALRGLVRGRRLSPARAEQAIEDLAGLRLVCHPHAPLRRAVWRLRHDLTAYDATYLALAMGFGDPVLLTSDRGLADRARRVLGGDRVVLTA